MPEMFSAGQGGTSDHDHSTTGSGGALLRAATYVNSLLLQEEMMEKAGEVMTGKSGLTTSGKGLALMMAFGG